MSRSSRFGVVCLVLAVLIVVPVAVSADEMPSRKEADWRMLAKLAVQFAAELDSQTRFTREGSYMSTYAAWKQAYVPFWADFQKRYGATLPEVQAHFKGMQKPKGIAQGIDYLIWAANRINVERHESQMVQWAERYAANQHRQWKRLFDQNHENVEVMMRHADRSAHFPKLAAKLNPSGDYTAAIRAGQDAVEKTLPKYKSHLEKKNWPAHNTSYKGADTPQALAAAALEFLRKHTDWTAPEFDDSHTPTVAVVAGSGWTVYKAEPLTNRPLQYSIKMLVAFTGEKHADLAYCYYMELYTAQRLGVKPALPFQYANARQFESYRMLRKNLPQ